MPHGFTHALLIVLGAIITLAMLVATHKPSLWTVMVMAKPGDQLHIPVGDGQFARPMRVIRVENGIAYCIDIMDEQKYMSMAIGLAIAWMLTLPVIMVMKALGWFSKKRWLSAVLGDKTRATRLELGTTWKS